MIRIFYVGFMALFIAMAAQTTPAFASELLKFEIDCNHSKLSNTGTKDKIAVEFYDGDKLVYAKIDKLSCSSTSDAEYWGVFRNTADVKAVDNIKVKTQGRDALFIDEIKWQGYYKAAYIGKDNGKGWCLSTNKSDGKGDWKNHVDQSFGCQSCLKFVRGDQKAYSCK